MVKIPVIKDANGDFVVVSQIAAVQMKKDYEFTLVSGIKVQLKEFTEDGKLDANLIGQLQEHFGD